MQYVIERFRSFRQDDDGNLELMANFVANIIRETKFIDGLTTRTLLLIEGEMPAQDDPDHKLPAVKLQPIEVEAEAFASMNWVMPNWGVRVVIRPGSGIKDDLRTMIQLHSRPELKTVYKQTGWATVDGERRYLHVGGGIGKKGNDKSIEVRLPPELAKFNLTTKVDAAAGVRATLDLLKLGREDLIWPLIAATLTPVYGPCDFAVHLTGRTGSFKSEVMSLFQAHYGPEMDARKLPGSWASTPNALEALAFFCCNAAMVIDDFVPAGTAWQQRAYQQNADKIIRAQGNQAGRARLSDTSNLQQTMYPRGLILSTGEDTPEGHSVRARMLIMELAGGEIDAKALTAAQGNRPNFSATIAALVQWLAKEPADLKPRAEELRNQYRSIGHSRTPSMLGRLIATVEDWLVRCEVAGILKPAEAKKFAKAGKAAIEKAGSQQQGFLEDSDPVDVFSATLRQVLASGGGHFRTLNGGVPSKASLLGWNEERSSGEMATFKARGPCLGWCSIIKDELYVDVTVGFSAIKKSAGADMPLSKQTLFKRLKDAGLMTRTDEGRQRNTVRVTAENHPRQVLCLSLSTTLDQEDMTDDQRTGDGPGGEDFGDPDE